MAGSPVTGQPLPEPLLPPGLLFAAELFRVSRRWDAELDERLRVTGFGRATWATLFWLSRNPEGMMQRSLAGEVGVEMSTLTRQLDLLEAAGLVRRAAVPGDRRAKKALLTEAAGAVLEQMAAVAAALRDELLQDIKAADLDIALAVLRTVRAKL